MFGSVIIEVAIGLVLVFLLISLIGAAVREAIADLLSTRAKELEKGIVELLQDKNLVETLYSHPQVSALYRGSYSDAKAKPRLLPSYIPSRNFALALLDIVARGRDISNPMEAGGDATVLSLATIRQQVARIESKPVQRILLTTVDTAQGDLRRMQQGIEAWFDSSMDRVSGWYRRQTQWILLAIGLVLAVGLNVDTLRVAHRLYHDPTARQAAVAMAESVNQQPTAPPTDTAAASRRAAARDRAQVALAQLDSLGLPIGWPDPQFGDQWFLRFIGWIVTAVAVSLGAPFWFDTLNKIMTIRSTVKPHEKSPEEGSKDRQADRGDDQRKSDETPVVAVVRSGGTVGGGGGQGGGTTRGDEPGFQPHEWSSGYPQGGII